MNRFVRFKPSGDHPGFKFGVFWDAGLAKKFECKCEYCGITFKALTPKEKFCCNAHKYRQNYNNKVGRNSIKRSATGVAPDKCLWCGTPFIQNDKKTKLYCDSDCGKKYRMRRSREKLQKSKTGT